MMKHALQFKLMILITLSNIFQLVRFSEQRPQNSDEVGYYSIAQPFTDESNQYDDTPIVPSDDSPAQDDEYSSDDCEKRSTQNETSHVKGSHFKRRDATNATFANAKNPEDKIPILAHDSLDRKKRSTEDAQGNRKIRMSDWKKGFPRSFKKRSFRDDNEEIYKERGLISGDERFPHDIFRIRRSADDEKKSDKSGDSSNASLPTLSIQQLDKSTEINASISTPDTSATVHLPLEDVLSLIKVKRSAYDNEGLEDSSISSLENGEEIFSIESKEEIDVAESSVIFKPLFRYRSQIGQRRRVYNNY